MMSRQYKLMNALLILLVATAYLSAEDDARQQEEVKSDVTLKMRTDNGAYKKSAFSFRQDTQDVVVHKNYVDLVYNKCGHLHFNPVGTMKSRVADLGELKLEDAPKKLSGDEKWSERSVMPKAGHVYIQKIDAQNQKMLVQFRIDKIEQDTVSISWRTLEELKGDLGRRGQAGTMGQCGGQHQAK